MKKKLDVVTHLSSLAKVNLKDKYQSWWELHKKKDLTENMVTTDEGVHM